MERTTRSHPLGGLHSLNYNASVATGIRHLDRYSKDLSTSFNRLSSGVRITNAGDDAAALALSEQLNGKIRVLTQSVRNINDGVSLLTIADSTIESLKAIVSRNLELATQAANGAYTSTQRAALDSEAASLTAEYNRIINSTTFNGTRVFTDSGTVLNVQSGTSGSDHMSLTVGTSLVTSSISAAEGDGTFAAERTISDSGASYQAHFLFADQNNDGIDDIIATSQGSPYKFTVLLSNGDGSFKAPVNGGLRGNIPYNVAAADFNGDGAADLVHTDYHNAATFEFALMVSNGDGTFNAGVTYGTMTPAYAYETAGVTALDVNGDGKQDVVVADRSANGLRIFYGNGNGTFAASVSTPIGSTPNDVLAVDVNADGILDLVANSYIDSFSIGVTISNGNGTFVAPQMITTTNSWTFLRSGDFNNDGKTDLYQGFWSSGTPMFLYLGNGNGTFNAWTTTGYTIAGSSQDAKIADLNGDGNQDIVVSDYTAGVKVFFGNGNATFKAPTTISALINTYLGVHDVTGDGILDLVKSLGGYSKFGLSAGQGTAGVNTGTADLTTVSIATQSAAQSAIGSFNTALDKLNRESANIGSHLSRLDVEYNVVSRRRDEYQAAFERITSVDVAEESGRLVNLQVRSDAATAVLAQANQQSTVVLSLIKGL